MTGSTQMNLSSFVADISADLPRFAAFSVDNNANFRAIWFSAASLDEAREFCAKNGFVYGGPAEFHPKGNGAIETLSAQETMARLKICRSTLYRLLVRGELKRLRGLGAVRVTRRSLEEYLASAA